MSRKKNAASSTPSPLSFTVDDIRGIDDPIGMTGEYLTADVHLITASDMHHQKHRQLRQPLPARCAGLCHCQRTPPDLSALTEDERELGVTLIEMGGGVTGISVFYHGKNIFTDIRSAGAVRTSPPILRAA